MAIEFQTITKQDRDKLLDELDKETRRWTQAERKRINEQADFLKRVLKARTGSGKLVTTNLDKASKLTAVNINNLLGIKAAQKKKS